MLPLCALLRQLLGPACRPLGDLLTTLAFEELAPAAASLAALQLAEPLTPMRELAARQAVSISEVKAAARFLQESPSVSVLARSRYYPHRLAVTACRTTISEWLDEPDRLCRLLAGEPVLSKTVEVHPSLGTCAFKCAMCLWSDKNDLTYDTMGLTGDGLVQTDGWLSILSDLAERGLGTVVVSGGGEALLNRELWRILERARILGLRTHLYTTGLNLPARRAQIWEELVRLDRIRFSVHSPDPARYCQLTGLSPATRPLRRVLGNVRRLIDLRSRHDATGSVGLGFVIQELNWDQIQQMADLSASLGVDFLDIRKDEVDVTRHLSAQMEDSVTADLVAIRERLLSGAYGTLDIDISDELTLLANGGKVPPRRRTDECRAKFFRPTISPFGLLAPCDLKAEPRFARTGFDFGAVHPGEVDDALAELARQVISDACAQCMPSSRTGNAVYSKLLQDLADGVALTEQPFSDAIQEARQPCPAGEPPLHQIELPKA